MKFCLFSKKGGDRYSAIDRAFHLEVSVPIHASIHKQIVTSIHTQMSSAVDLCYYAKKVNRSFPRPWTTVHGA